MFLSVHLFDSFAYSLFIVLFDYLFVFLDWFYGCFYRCCLVLIRGSFLRGWIVLFIFWSVNMIQENAFVRASMWFIYLITLCCLVRIFGRFMTMILIWLCYILQTTTYAYYYILFTRCTTYVHPYSHTDCWDSNVASFSLNMLHIAFETNTCTSLTLYVSAYHLSTFQFIKQFFTITCRHSHFARQC